jgi:nickel transport protein
MRPRRLLRPISIPWLVLTALALLGVAAPAIAHEVLHEVERGRATAVRARFHDGESLADLQAEVFSPADGKVPHWKGRTDRNGWLAFIPDVPGKWRVRIVDSTGHGLDTTVEVAAPVSAPGAAGSVTETAPARATSLASVLRPLVGVALIAVIFGFLYLRGRRRAS